MKPSVGRRIRILAAAITSALVLTACPTSGPRAVPGAPDERFPSSKCAVKPISGYVGDTFLRLGYTPGSAAAVLPAGQSGVDICLRVDGEITSAGVSEPRPVRFGGRVTLPSSHSPTIDHRTTDADCSGQTLLATPDPLRVKLFGQFAATIKASVASRAQSGSDKTFEVRTCVRVRVEGTGEDLIPGIRILVKVPVGEPVPTPKPDADGSHREPRDTSNRGLASAACRESGANANAEILDLGLLGAHVWLDALDQAQRTMLCARVEGPSAQNAAGRDAAGGNIAVTPGDDPFPGPGSCQTPLVDVDAGQTSLSLGHGDPDGGAQVCLGWRAPASAAGGSYAIAVEGAPAETGFTLDEDSRTVLSLGEPSPSPVSEGGSVTIPVYRSGPSATALTANWSTGDGTARSPSDYPRADARPIVFGPGERQADITVPIAQDLEPEVNEWFKVILRDPAPPNIALAGGSDEAVVWIRDDDARLSFGSSAVDVEEDAGSVALQVRRSYGTAGRVTVRYSTADGTARSGKDYTAANGTTLAFAPDQDVADIAIAVSDNALFGSNRQFRVTLSDASGAHPQAAATIVDPRTATVTILEDEQPVYRVDALLSADGGYIGNDVVRTAARSCCPGQERRMRVARGGSATFLVRVQNDGNVRDAFSITGTRTSRGVSVRYFAGARDITDAVISSGHTLGELDPAALSTPIKVVVSVGSDASRGTSRDILVTARGVQGGRDIVKTTIRVA